MHHTTRKLRYLLPSTVALATAALLAACGGGNGGKGVEALLESGASEREQTQAVQYRLTVHTTGGQGHIFSTVGGVDCGPVCSVDLDAGTVLSLRAVPEPGFVFDAWVESHAQACNDFVSCKFTMNGAKTITARFAPIHPLAECSVTRSNAAAPVISATHPKLLLANAEFKDCMQKKFSLQAPEAMRLKVVVDRAMAGGARDADFAPWWPALMYQATGDDRYAKYAVKFMDDIVKSEEALIAQGIAPRVAFDKYLHADFYIAGLAMVWDWVPHHDGPGDTGTNNQLTPEMRARWLAYANQAVWNIWKAPLQGGAVQAVWGGRLMPWDLWGRDNPANNYYYHFLNALMSLGVATHGENPQAAEWVDLFRSKVANELHPLFNRDLVGGGSREGTGYGTTGRLIWTIYDTWERSTGERLADKSPYALASLAHQIHNIVPTLDRMSPTGDQSRDASAALFDYHRDYMLELVNLFPNEPLAGVGKKLIARSSVPRQRFERDFYADVLYAPPKNVVERDADVLSTTYWGEGTGQLLMRSSWAMDATFANFICGPYTESHAHADQGSFVVFRGDWLAYDRNIRSDSGLEQGMEAHNLVRLKTTSGQNVEMTSMGTPCRVMALADTPQYTYMSADVTPLYSFRHSYVNNYNNHLVKKVQREFLYIKPSTFIVMDRVESTTPTQHIWTMNLPFEPSMQGDRFGMQNGANRLDVFRIGGADTATSTTPQASNRGNGTNWRVDTARTASASTFLHVLGTNGSVASAAADDTQGSIGARVQLADGRVVVARFPTAALGGQLEIVNANGATVLTGDLPKTIGQPAVLAADAPPPIRQAPSPYVPNLPSDPAPAPGPTPSPPPNPSPSPSPTPAPAPKPSLSASLDGTVFPLGDSVPVSVALTSAPGLARVELWRNGAKVAELASAPYNFVLTGLDAGNHRLEARAFYVGGAEQRSTTINVFVDTPAPAPVNDTVVLRQGLNGYAAVSDVGVSNQNVQYNGGRGQVSNDAKTGVFSTTGNSPYEVRSFLRFGGLASLAGRRVTKAELSLTFNFGMSGYTLAGKYLAAPWTMAATNFGWGKRTESASWAAPGSGGSDWLTHPGLEISGFTGSLADTRRVLLDPAVVQAWIDNPASNFGLVLTPTVSNKTSWLRSSEDTTMNYRPTLQLWFE